MTVPWHYADPAREADREASRARVCGRTDTYAFPPYPELIQTYINDAIRAQSAQLDWILTVATISQPTPFWPMWVGKRLRDARLGGDAP